MTFWDTFIVGEPIALGAHRFTAEAIVRFAEKYDPQIFHLDPERAKASVLGGLCASGWHTASACMRLNVDYRYGKLKRWLEAGNPMPRIGPSPGFKTMRWPRPVYAGDRVQFTQTVTDKRVSETRPGWGLVSFSTLGVNQDGAEVFSFDGVAFQGTD
ncbi:MaoC family dehydratase [Jiella sp. MQZ9-1]|uniref:MaoC family dehydratase n=1 Tax=Jiella flava TaxID=2816857 RepID=A0A939JSU9_9HYPH|nr:MaoC family dehydratase [Jiella flava]MBO0663333.1 MaoC family dehydratase [Jiella flava]MCD2471909.1 MaoC family dehydratase [Jiella flava]